MTKLYTQAVVARPVFFSEVQKLDLAALHSVNPQRYPFLLESVAKGSLGRYSVLMALPGDSLQLDSPHNAQEFTAQAQQVLAITAQNEIQLELMLADDERLDRARLQSEAEALPFKGGWFAYFSYDYAQVVEPVLELPASEFPLANLTRCHAAVILDHETESAWLVAEKTHQSEMASMLEDMQTVLRTANAISSEVSLSHLQEEEEKKYLDGVAQIKEYILAGDVFQVNLSRQWQASLAEDQDYLQVYQALRVNNPAPFAALACLKDQDGQPWQIISSSPERLVKYDGEWVDTRPIAGTRRRSDDDAADRALMDELIAHPKERAEHIMLIDLERNDLGRICRPGSVEVNELMVIESYEHVHHIVSNVRGRLRDGFSPLDIVHALFPGGTITGCPKVRCMEIIAELEQMPREAYTGSLGYINLDGTLDLNILIRTLIQSECEGHQQIQFRAGAGIVADSQPELELIETRHKARGLLRAFGQSDA
ncbi:aminodeoxychorismate synthase component I [Thiomicrorhabdus sp. 6S3-12]|uniref:aminodeoxychorismate synthase component I n=1 Tax=Thiomicrorhabdus sp. 6S3-12 TaxID=2819681 RepID=UPI001AAC878A|nr:aminodeoxychorismate synthase component I [Thiomicrorhabdus sp. 6S3-12]MBO1924192.1 aminodeoxychorismate synthase component I [Thiomicrorhabdus sp. 6S3-12]